MPPGLSERELSPRGFGTSHGTHDSIQNSVSQYVLYVTIDARSALQAGLLHGRPPPTVIHACLVQAVLWTCLVQVVLRTRASHLPRFFPSPPIPLPSFIFLLLRCSRFRSRPPSYSGQVHPLNQHPHGATELVKLVQSPPSPNHRPLLQSDGGLGHFASASSGHSSSISNQVSSLSVSGQICPQSVL